MEAIQRANAAEEEAAAAEAAAALLRAASTVQQQWQMAQRLQQNGEAKTAQRQRRSNNGKTAQLEFSAYDGFCALGVVKDLNGNSQNTLQPK